MRVGYLHSDNINTIGGVLDAKRLHNILWLSRSRTHSVAVSVTVRISVLLMYMAVRGDVHFFYRWDKNVIP